MGLISNRRYFSAIPMARNLLAAMMQLHPHLVRNAVLLRATKVLEEAPEADLSGTRILAVTGDHDLFGAHSPALEAELKKAGADITTASVPAGHETGAHDIEVVRQWLMSKTGQN